MTHWFYERARAQYQAEQIKLTPAQKKAFDEMVMGHGPMRMMQQIRFVYPMPGMPPTTWADARKFLHARSGHTQVRYA